MILITGASGYIGSHITRRLAESGRQVRAMVYNREKAKAESRLNGLDIDWIESDVTRSETLDLAFKNIEAVIHTVAIAIETAGRTYEAINYQGTVNVANAAKQAGVTRFINMSQLGANPDLPYRFLASKGKAQSFVAASGLDWTAFRPSVIWGPEDEFANTFARLIPFSPLIYPIVGDETARFQPIWVEDVATCFVKALGDPDTIGQEYELGGPEVLTLEQIERRTLKAANTRRWMVPFPMPILRLVVALMEATIPNPPVTRSLLELLQVSNVTRENSITRFVPEPRAFQVETIAGYMRTFRAGATLAQFFGR